MGLKSIGYEKFCKYKVINRCYTYLIVHILMKFTESHESVHVCNIKIFMGGRGFALSVRSCLFVKYFYSLGFEA